MTDAQPSLDPQATGPGLQTHSRKMNPRRIQGGTTIEGLASDVDIRDAWT